MRRWKQRPLPVRSCLLDKFRCPRHASGAGIGAVSMKDSFASLPDPSFLIDARYHALTRSPAVHPQVYRRYAGSRTKFWIPKPSPRRLADAPPGTQKFGPMAKVAIDLLMLEAAAGKHHVSDCRGWRRKTLHTNRGLNIGWQLRRSKH